MGTETSRAHFLWAISWQPSANCSMISIPTWTCKIAPNPPISTWIHRSIRSTRGRMQWTTTRQEYTLMHRLLLRLRTILMWLSKIWIPIQTMEQIRFIQLALMTCGCSIKLIALIARPRPSMSPIQSQAEQPSYQPASCASPSIKSSAAAQLTYGPTLTSWTVTSPGETAKITLQHLTAWPIMPPH